MIWLPFDPHPEYPAEGIQRAELQARYGDAFHERLKQSFAASGLVYNPPPDLVPNTMRALRVTEHARERGLHRHAHDRLMRAYWEEARNIGDSSEVLALAVEAGLDEKAAAEVIKGDAYQERVRVRSNRQETDRASSPVQGRGPNDVFAPGEEAIVSPCWRQTAPFRHPRELQPEPRA